MTHIEEEKRTVSAMIELYCRKKHGSKTLCQECQSLLDYSMARLDNCKFGNDKPTCSKCPIHCYKPEMREKIRTVMRFSGPRMIFYHPVMAVKHVVRSLRGV